MKLLLGVTAGALALVVCAASAATLGTVRDRGTLVCGTSHHEVVAVRDAAGRGTRRVVGQCRRAAREQRAARGAPLLGVEAALGTALGLDEAWAYRIVKQVGNYAESFDRNLGARSPLNLPRGINALWNRGGIVYPMPFR